MTETETNWEGVETREIQHHTVGGRAWCLTDSEWCTPEELCDCCHTALGHAPVWIPQKDSDEYIQLAVKIHMDVGTDIASERGCVLSVLDALWEMQQ